MNKEFHHHLGAHREAHFETDKLILIEFQVGETLFAMDILKVREIIKANIPIVSVPNAHPFIEGAINLRGEILPIINLAKQLKKNTAIDKENNRIIICDFGKLRVGLLVTAVFNIHRTSSQNIEKPSQLLQMEEGYTCGVIRFEEKVLFILDYQKIVFDINPKINRNDF